MRKTLNLVATVMFCAVAFISISCEDDISDVGSGLLDTGASANAHFVDLIAYNTNNDSIRSDAKVLQNAVVGVYEDNVFGRTKAKFITQARMSRTEPNFGSNAEMDSVILTVPVFYNRNDVDVDTTYLYLNEGETPSDTATILLKRTYKLDSIYGNTSLPMTLQVREVAEYLYSLDSVYYSNPNLSACQSCPNINDIQVFDQVLGEATVGDKIITHQVGQLGELEGEPAVGLNIKLDKDYFKQKFIENQNSIDLRDQASFIRNFFRGIELSVANNEGFLMNFNSSSADFRLTMHYSYDNPAEDTGEDDYEERLSNLFFLAFSSAWSSPAGHNVQVNQFEHYNRSSQFVNAYTNPNTELGDARLYLAGMDGTKTIIKLDEEQLNEVRNNVQNNNWAIVGAELNFHVDESYGFKKPPYLFAWHSFKDGEKTKQENFSDIRKFFNSYPYLVQFNPMYNYDADPNTYTIRITDHIKRIVERDEEFEDGEIIVSVGNFLLNPATSYANVYNVNMPYLNDRAFNPHRVVLHGSNSEQEDKRVKLKIYYTKN